MMKPFFDWVIDIAALPLCVGIVLALLDFLRAYQRWGGNGRWLTFDSDFRWRFALLYIGALLVELLTSLVFYLGTFSGYIAALARALVQAGIFVVGILAIDSILRTLGRLRSILTRHSRRGVTVVPTSSARAPDTTGDIADLMESDLDMLLRTALQADLGTESEAHHPHHLRQRHDDHAKGR
jgi:hypothetical protein